MKRAKKRMICSIAFINSRKENGSTAFILNIKVVLSAFFLFTYKKKVLIFIWILQKSKLMWCKVRLDNYSIIIY